MSQDFRTILTVSANENSGIAELLELMRLINYATSHPHSAGKDGYRSMNAWVPLLWTGTDVLSSLNEDDEEFIEGVALEVDAAAIFSADERTVSLSLCSSYSIVQYLALVSKKLPSLRFDFDGRHCAGDLMSVGTIVNGVVDARYRDLVHIRVESREQYYEVRRALAEIGDLSAAVMERELAYPDEVDWSLEGRPPVLIITDTGDPSFLTCFHSVRHAEFADAVAA